MWRYIVLAIVCARAEACVCGGPWASVKQAWQRAHGVFLGTVESAVPDEDAAESMFQEQFVRIRVDEAFKGVFRGQTIELHQGANDCAAKFKAGQKLVFYLDAGWGHRSWRLPPCTHAMGSAETDGDDLLFLRALP